MQFSFIHAADLHIGSPFRGLSAVDENLRNKLLQASRDAFHSLVAAAIENEVDFVLICGDSFDSASGSLAEQFIFATGMRRLMEKNIAVYLITGNHDPLSDWSQNLRLPENVTIFKPDQPQRIVFQKNGTDAAAIYGVSYAKREENRNLALRFQRQSDDPFSIALLHGTTGNPGNHDPYCPFSLDDLRNAGMDYWALGHIHKREIIHPNNPMVVYPGNIQGRHFNEAGEKGCYLVRVNNNRIEEPQFLPLGKVVWINQSINLNETEYMDALTALLENHINDLQNQYPDCSLLIRPEFTGSTPLYADLANPAALDELLNQLNQLYRQSDNFVFFTRPKNHTLPQIDLAERRMATDFFGELLREVESIKNDPEELKKVLTELKDELPPNISRRLTDDVDKEEILNAAEQILISSFLEKTSGQ